MKETIKIEKEIEYEYIIIKIDKFSLYIIIKIEKNNEFELITMKIEKNKRNIFLKLSEMSI